MATSFFTDRDEPIASVLTRTLLETKQEVPAFLQPYIPENYAEGIKVKFETESDFDPNDVAGAGDAAGGDWGGDDTGDAGNAESGAGAWEGNDNVNTDSGGGGWGGGSAANHDTANSGGGWGQESGTKSGDAWGASTSGPSGW